MDRMTNRQLRNFAPANLSLRDPDGSCFRLNNRIIRFVNTASSARARVLLDSALIRDLEKDGLVPATRVLGPREIQELLCTSDLRLRAAPFDKDFALEHTPIEFPSYPYEWCPEALFEAANLTLTLQFRALAAGFSLKDATPSNVLFCGSRPVFVDFFSFVPKKEGVFTWIAYAQFVRTFLYPLLLYRTRRASTGDYLLSHPDGLTPTALYKQLIPFERLRPKVVRYVTVPAFLCKSKRALALSDTTGSRQFSFERASFVFDRLIRGLQSSLDDLSPRTPIKSAWTEYPETRNYSARCLSAKANFVRDALAESSASSVLDIGCNTGQFSFLANELGASVVAIDRDPGVVSMLWARSHAAGANINPLVIDFARPSPALGWRNLETPSFLDRARGRFDFVLLLAVIHHLALSDNIPLTEIFELCAEIVTRGLVVEFVPKTDPMAQLLSRNKEHLLDAMSQHNFEAALSPYFSIIRRVQLPDSLRWLYFLCRRTP